jgi:hypothetical protein
MIRGTYFSNFFKVASSITVVVLVVIFIYMQSDSDVKEGQFPIPEIKPRESKVEDDTFDVVRPSSGSAESNATIWRAKESITNTPHLRSDITDAELVSYKREVIRNLSIGSTIEVPIPQLHQTLSILITSSDLLSSGNVSMRGHLRSNEIFSFVMTLGESSMFATIGTPEGIYNVSGNKNSAWIIPAASLKKQMNTDILDYRSK